MIPLARTRQAAQSLQKLGPSSRHVGRSKPHFFADVKRQSSIASVPLHVLRRTYDADERELPASERNLRRVENMQWTGKARR